jgi:hypothetical protein
MAKGANEALVEIENLCKLYGSFEAVKDFSLSVATTASFMPGSLASCPASLTMTNSLPGQW